MSMTEYTDNFLTDKQEIIRLRKIIEEKNAAIKGFKKYDADRKKYYARLEENYKIMEERFSEINAAIDKCEDLDSNSKEYYHRLVTNLNVWKYNNEVERTALGGVLTRLNKLKQHIVNIETLVWMVESDDAQKQIRKEIGYINSVRGNLIQYINNKLKKLI